MSLLLIGSTPLLLHRISKHQLRDQIAARVGAGGSLEDVAREVMSKDSHGNPMVPVSWLSDAMRVGCSRIIVEGKQLSSIKISSSVQLPDGLIALKDRDNRPPVWTPYASVQHGAPGSKQSIAVVAPSFKDWMLSFQVQIDEAFPDDELLLRVFAEAGRGGIGLFHPPKKHFGQFRVMPVLGSVWSS